LIAYQILIWRPGLNILKPVIVLALLSAGTALAQTDGESRVILPLEAQTCNLPVAPARIPEEADISALGKAKGNITDFQSAMGVYRDCLSAASKNGIMTDGNEMAVNNAHNYSVEMETRMAEQFNVAVCTYKQHEGMELSDTCKQRLGLTE